MEDYNAEVPESNMQEFANQFSKKHGEKTSMFQKYCEAYMN